MSRSNDAIIFLVDQAEAKCLVVFRKSRKSKRCINDLSESSPHLRIVGAGEYMIRGFVHRELYEWSSESTLVVDDLIKDVGNIVLGQRPTKSRQKTGIGSNFVTDCLKQMTG